jgi:hypothetical protein
MLFLLLMATPITVGAEVSPGETIDKTNWQKVEGLLPEPVLNWVKKGDFILKIGELRYSPRDYLPPVARESMVSNQGKYAINEKDIIVETKTGKVPEYIEGMPFPEVDLADPKAGEKLLYNKHYHSLSYGSLIYPIPVTWVGRGGYERQVLATYINAPLDGYPPNRALPNPDGIERYNIINVVEPYDLRGFAVMLWRFRDDRQDMNLSYVPAIRRVRRMSPANRSDAFVGSDLSMDDAWGYEGKIDQFRWKVVGQQEALFPYSSDRPETIVKNSKGEWQSTPDVTPNVYGFQKEGWTGAPWAPVDYLWVKKQVVVIEAVAKDPYYNYGRQVIWFDPEIFQPRYKVVYDRSGGYWKTYLNGFSGAESKDGEMKNILIMVQIMVDDRTQHATLVEGPTKEHVFTHFADMDMNDFTLSGFQKYCK